MQQYMMLTMPNSGSTWLAPILARHAGLSYYDKEFFSPTCNPMHREMLSAAGFGSELISTFKGIAAEWERDRLDAVYGQTWARYAWDFDKEVYGPWKADWYMRHFDCFVLDRRPGSIFPPSRSQVMGWYEAIYFSLVSAERIKHDPSLTLMGRAMLAHRLGREQLCVHRLPTVSNDVLMVGDQRRVRAELEKLPFAIRLDVEAAVDEIVRTRAPNGKTWRDIH